jgi:predicted Zn-ribbon and HTH transcriptional regulator
MTEMREKIDELVKFARQREAAARLLDCIPGAEQRLQQAKNELLALIEPVMEENERLREALEPFANCVEQIKATEDDEEWAKFRLLIKDYRRAAKAIGLTMPGFKRCPTCDGEFDEGEWEASSECPECETPIARAALSPKSEKYDVCMASDCANTEPHEIGSADCTKSEKRDG